MHSIRVIAILFVAIVSAGCGNRLPFDVSLAPTQIPAVETSGELTLVMFARQLLDGGASVHLRGEVKQPFFPINGKVVAIGGESVQVYEYNASEAARAVADAITSDGSAITTGDISTIVDWASTPHFYHRGRLIVVYVGENESVLDVLDDTLGTPFAGAASYRGMYRTAG